MSPRPAPRWILRVAGAATAVAISGLFPAAEPMRLAIDPAVSHVLFDMDTTWHGVQGKTARVTGEVTSMGGDLFSDGKVAVEVDAASLDTGNSRRDRTMRDAHLETARYPAITFVSTAPPSDVRRKDNEVAFKVTGDLTIHGVTRKVTVPARATDDGGSWVVTGEFPVKLSDHSIPDPSIMFNRVKDEVRVSFTLHLKG